LPPVSQPLYGNSSFVWASVLNCPGIDFRPIIHNVGTSNIWSWPNTRAYEMAGLTNSSPSDRSAGLAQMFRGLGQVAHLLQDTTSPQHARNEQHLDKVVNWWESSFEDYGGSHSQQLNYTNSLLDWRGAGFSKLRDFWDRDLYTTNNTQTQNSLVLSNDANGGTQLSEAPKIIAIIGAARSFSRACRPCAGFRFC
jgi:hypothetical protein